MDPSTTRQSAQSRDNMTKNNSAYLPIDRTREEPRGSNNDPRSRDELPMSRWRSEDSREQPWNAIREVSSDASAYHPSEVARQYKGRDSVHITQGSDTRR